MKKQFKEIKKLGGGDVVKIYAEIPQTREIYGNPDVKIVSSNEEILVEFRGMDVVKGNEVINRFFSMSWKYEVVRFKFDDSTGAALIWLR